VVNFFYYRYTIARDISLPGHEIQNIKFASRNEKREFGPLTKKQKILFLLLDIIGGYVADKMRAHFENTQDHELSKPMVIAKKTFQWLDKIYKLLSLINFVLFIRTFKYHTLVERILKIEYDHIRQGVRRTLDFEYMNRTIIWNVLSDFMAFALPYMQYGFGEMLKKCSFSRLLSGVYQLIWRALKWNVVYAGMKRWLYHTRRLSVIVNFAIIVWKVWYKRNLKKERPNITVQPVRRDSLKLNQST